MKFKSTLMLGLLLCASSLFAADVNSPADDANVKLARAFEQHILKRENAAAEPMFDSGALIDRGEAGISASKEIASGFKEGAIDLNKNQIGALTQQISAGGHFVFLRVHQRAGKPVALFRLLLADDSFDYLEWYIEPDANGKLRFVDLYDAAKGELMSQTVRRIYLSLVVSQDKQKGNGAQFGAKENVFIDSMDQVKQMNEAARAGEYQKAIDMFHALPASVQKEKFLMVARVMAAQKLIDTKPAEYENAIVDFEKTFPNDPAIDLLGFAHLVDTKQYLAAHQAVDRLIAFTGGDAHLQCMHGQIYLVSATPADLASAVDSYKKAINDEPENHEGYWGLVTVYLRQKDYANTAAELTDIQQKLHLKLKDLHTQPVYADFVKSPEYKKWVANQPKDIGNK